MDDETLTYEFGTNPCSVRSSCAPTSSVTSQKLLYELRTHLKTLERKVRLATILGTIQSTYTHFPYLRKVWQRNTEEERLLGCQSDRYHG